MAMRTLTLILLAAVGLGSTQIDPKPQLLGGRTRLDAHNAYTEEGKYSDRIDRALATRLLPLVIEQDVAYASTSRQSVVSHDTTLDGTEPALERYFFDRIKPIAERELKTGARAQWPLIVLHLDFKTNEREHHKAVWDLLMKYRAWLTTAPVDGNVSRVSPVTPGPVLVITENGENQEKDFLEFAATAKTHLLFGSIPGPAIEPTKDEAELARRRIAATPRALIPARATTYRRWVNFPWAVIEEGGPPNAGAWTKQDEARLQSVVSYAHAQGLLIRFYTLNGHSEAESQGWSAGYNFGTLQAAQERWRAAIRVDADLIATDQYEQLAALLYLRK